MHRLRKGFGTGKMESDDLGQQQNRLSLLTKWQKLCFKSKQGDCGSNSNLENAEWLLTKTSNTLNFSFCATDQWTRSLHTQFQTPRQRYTNVLFKTASNSEYSMAPSMAEDWKGPELHRFLQHCDWISGGTHYDKSGWCSFRLPVQLDQLNRQHQHMLKLEPPNGEWRTNWKLVAKSAVGRCSLIIISLKKNKKSW